MRTYDDWLTELESEPLGRLWLRKFRYDLNNNNIAAEIEETWKSIVNDKLRSSASLTALAVVESVIMENPRSFDLVGLRIPPDGQQYSLIVRLEVFAYYYLNPRVVMTILDERDDILDYIWENLDTKISPKFYKGWVKTDRDFFWCAPKRTIAKIVTDYKANPAATILRNRLGLYRMEKGERLVRIDVPPEALKNKKLCAPTTLDSGVSPIFVPCNNPDGYGRTLNLRRSARDVREAVAEKISFDGSFGVARVGRVATKVPSVSWAVIESLLD